MFAMAIVLSLSLCACMFRCADKVLFMMAISGVAASLACGIFIARQKDSISQFAILFFIITILYAIFVCYLRENLEKAAILSKTIVLFIQENKKIIFIVVITLVYSLAVVVLWMLGFYSFIVRYYTNDLSQLGFVLSSVFWWIVLAFFIFQIYYTSVFLTSYSLAIWFYQKEDVDSIGTPLKHLGGYHLGTITFASLIIAPLRLIKVLIVLVYLRKTDGLVGCLCGICSYLLCLCCGALEAAIQILNTYAIVTCALTGEGFLESAQIAGHIAYADY